MNFYTSPNYSLAITQTSSLTTINMTILTNLYSTKEIPLTKSILKQVLPSVLSSKCFNPSNLPFWREVEQTEMGHLFEHILLEYLCIKKIDLGASESVYNGTTYWNWQEEPAGTFTIHIDIGEKEKDIFTSAFTPAVKLMEQVFQQVSLPSYNSVLASNLAQ